MDTNDHHFDLEPASGRSARKVAFTILALGIASAAVVFGSLAAWTAQTTNPGNTVTAGNLTLGNDKPAAAVFTATDIKPGDTGGSTVTITNTGSVDMDVTLTKSGATVNALSADMDIRIYDATDDFCHVPDNAAGPCSGWADWSTAVSALDVGTWAGTEAHTFNIDWRFENTVANQNASKTLSASFDLTWDGVSA